MARKYILVNSPIKDRKIFIDDLKKIHKRRLRKTPSLPAYDTIKASEDTKYEFSEEMIFEGLQLETES